MVPEGVSVSQKPLWQLPKGIIISWNSEGKSNNGARIAFTFPIFGGIAQVQSSTNIDS